MGTENSFKPALKSLLKRMLVAVVRVALRNSIYLNDVIELVKGAYVHVAREQLTLNHGESSASRISAMTGVHRKDVTRLIGSNAALRQEVSLIGRIMSRWQSDSAFTTVAGGPRVLTVEGKESEFAELVTAVNGGDLSHYSVLFEMERMGIVQRTKGGLRLLWRDYVVDSNVIDGLAMASQDIYDLTRAVEENLYDTRPTKNLHLTTQFDNIAVDAVPQIQRWLLEEGSVFHQKARRYLSQFDGDMNSDGPRSSGGMRVVLGAFSLTEKTGAAQGKRNMQRGKGNG